MKKLISLFLVLIMLCAVSVTVFSVSALDENDVLTYDDEELIKPGIKTPTLDDDFEDDGVLFVMTEIASASNPVYTVEDFDESLGVASVIRITSDGAKNHIFYVELDKHDKQNVIDVVKELNKKGGILAAEPNYNGTLTDDLMFEDEFVEQYNLDGDYSYREVYYHRGENGEIDWAIIYALVDLVPSGLRKTISGRIISVNNIGSPFRLHLALYDVNINEFISIEDVDVTKYEGFEHALAIAQIGDLLGDTDSDNELSILDATEIQRVLAKITKWSDFDLEFVADYDQDGDVSIMDATAIQRRLAKLDMPVATADEAEPY